MDTASRTRPVAAKFLARRPVSVMPKLLPIVLAGLIVGGCGPRASGPEPSGPGAEGGAAGSRPKREQGMAMIKDLPTDRNAEFRVRVEKHSMEVVEHYDRDLLGRGWEKLQPTNPDDPGQREWVTMDVPAGPTDLFDAAWKDPKTGKTAILNLFHTKEMPEAQQGTFEVYGKGDAPWELSAGEPDS